MNERALMCSVKWAAILGLLAFSLGCAPETLEGLEENPNTTNNQSNMGGNNPTNMGGGDFTPEFVNVTSILTANCTQAACHGQFSANGFVVATDSNATPAEMRGALEGKMANVSGNLLINPGTPDSSDIWVRMNLPNDDPQYMPSTKMVLDQAAYDALEAWIANGAVYTQ